MGTPFFDNIRSFYDEDPNDPFNIYALALEYVKVDTGQAGALFDRLLSEFPDYLATYYHAGALHTESGNYERAYEIYEEGIRVATAQNNTKSKSELLNAFRNLQDEMDE